MYEFIKTETGWIVSWGPVATARRETQRVEEAVKEQAAVVTFVETAEVDDTVGQTQMPA